MFAIGSSAVKVKTELARGMVNATAGGWPGIA
jgi:hypothetical protein